MPRQAEQLHRLKVHDSWSHHRLEKAASRRAHTAVGSGLGNGAQRTHEPREERRRAGENFRPGRAGQDTFVKAFSALESYRPEFRFSSWILKIANNVTLNHLKRRGPETLALHTTPYASTPRKLAANALGLGSRSESTPARADPRELRAALQEAIGRLRGNYRRCFLLRYIDERSYDHIAEILDLPVGTVKSCVHRARNQVKDMLGPLHDASRRAATSGDLPTIA